MADTNIQIKQRNDANTGWDNIYPKTKAEVVTSVDGKTMEQHVTDTVIHVTASDKTDWNAKATTTYVDQKVADLVASSPGTLDTLNELALALGNDPDFATTMAGQIGNKFDKANVDTTPTLGTSDAKVPSQKAVKSYVDNSMSGAGNGDMLKSVYDTNDNGKVDNADFAERARIETSLASAEPTGTKAGEVWFATL